MRRDPLEADGPGSNLPQATQLDLLDIEAIRLLLSGQSVVDWAVVVFRDLAEVDDFLRLLCIDGTNADDQARLRYVYNEAIAYAEETMPHLRVREHLGRPEDVREVFLWAGQVSTFRRRQMLACVTLKLMHVIHHMQAAELKSKLPVSEAELMDRAEAEILRAARPLRDGAHGVRSFYGSRKSRTSTIAKLIAKSENIAATIFDKLRFRVVVHEQDDLVPALSWMTRNLFPFPYVIPGESHNNLVDPNGLQDWVPSDQRRHAQVFAGEGLDLDRGKNEFSAANYRAVNFIVDYPMVVSEQSMHADRLRYGRVVFVMVEFQVLDAATAKSNEEGDNAHHLYKARQWRTVEERLLRGSWQRKKRHATGEYDPTGDGDA